LMATNIETVAGMRASPWRMVICSIERLTSSASSRAVYR
jgi:hypothetical protein